MREKLRINANRTRRFSRSDFRHMGSNFIMFYSNYYIISCLCASIFRGDKMNKIYQVVICGTQEKITVGQSVEAQYRGDSLTGKRYQKTIVTSIHCFRNDDDFLYMAVLCGEHELWQTIPASQCRVFYYMKKEKSCKTDLV